MRASGSTERGITCRLWCAVPLLSWINPTSRTRASRPPVTITAIDSPMPLTRRTSSCRSTTVASAQYPFGKTPVEGICIALTTFAIVAGMSASEAAPIGNAVPHGMALPPHESSRQPASPFQNQINVVTERRHQTRTVCAAPATKSPPLAGSIQCTGRAGDRFREASFGACREEREAGCDGKHLRTSDRGRDSSQSVPDVSPGTSWRRANHAGHPRSLGGPALHT
jgi:hypothetical protein